MMNSVEIIKKIIIKSLNEQSQAGFTGKINYQVIFNQGGIRDFETVISEKIKMN